MTVLKGKILYWASCLILALGFGFSSVMAAPQSSSWNGTWIGNWENGHGTQIVFAGDELIAVYWHDDYLSEVHSTLSRAGTVVTITWPSAQATLTRDGATTAHIVIHEKGQPDISFAVKRDNQ